MTAIADMTGMCGTCRHWEPVDVDTLPAWAVAGEAWGRCGLGEPTVTVDPFTGSGPPRRTPTRHDFGCDQWQEWAP